MQSNWTLWQHAPYPGSRNLTPPGAGCGPPPPAALSASHVPETTTCILSFTPRNVPGGPRFIHFEVQSSAGTTGRRPAASASLTTLATAAPYTPVASNVFSSELPAFNPWMANAPPRSSSVCSPCNERLRKTSDPYCHQPRDLNVVCLARPPTKCATAIRGGYRFQLPLNPWKFASPATPLQPATSHGGAAAIFSGAADASSFVK